MKLYERTFKEWDRKRDSDQFAIRYRVEDGWYALEGTHHEYLDPHRQSKIYRGRLRVRHLGRNPGYHVGNGIVDLTEMAKGDPDVAAGFVDPLLSQSEDGPRAVLLAIDPAQPPETTIKLLRPHLKELYAPFKEKKELDTVFLKNDKYRHWISASKPGSESYKEPPFKDYKNLKTWLDYFKCYDLRTTTNQSFGDIAKQVYGQRTGKTYERAEQAVKRVRQMISAAENDNWPPTIR